MTNVLHLLKYKNTSTGKHTESRTHLRQTCAGSRSSGSPALCSADTKSRVTSLTSEHAQLPGTHTCGAAGMLPKLKNTDALQNTLNTFRQEHLYCFCRGLLLILCRVAVPEKTLIGHAAMLNTSLFTDVSQTIFAVVYYLLSYFNILVSPDLCFSSLTRTSSVRYQLHPLMLSYLIIYSPIDKDF